MKKTISLSIPLGYRLEDKIEYMKVWQAERYLRSGRGSRYTKAIRRDTDAQLHSKWLICPHCGKKHNANVNSPAFSKTAQVCSLAVVKPSGAQIAEWASMQMSFFDDPQGKELPVAPPVRATGRFTCPNCDNDSFASAARRQVILQACNKKITVKCALAQIDELLALGWTKVSEIKISFPIFEVLTFDFRRGRVYVRIEKAQGDALCQRDITNCPEQLQGGAVYKVLQQNKTVLWRVKGLFRDLWGAPLPYTWDRLDLPALFAMTMFVGYPKSFYDCIPYVKDSFRIDSGFRTGAKQMHLAEDLPEIYQKSGLPQVKSIKRLLFRNPGLFFYLNEVEKIWETVGDYNLLSRFLLLDRVYEILSALHMRPGMLLYLGDYCRVKGAVCLLAAMQAGWDDVSRRAIDYCCMSERMRLETQAQWRSGENDKLRQLPEHTYSLPMCPPDERIPDCTINGYGFFWLRNSNDYALAGKHLQNCLKLWRPCHSPVVGVRKRGNYVAAIEVRKGYVVQARGWDNTPLSAEPRLQEAFERWMARFGLEWGEREEDPYDLPDLPDMPF